MYKQSIFNIFFEKNMKYYLYNSYSGALICLDEENRNYLEKIQLNIEPDQFHNFEYYLRKGIIVKKSFDEFGYIYQKTQFHIYNKYPSSVSYTIVLTNRCNMKCNYCFEKNVLNKSQQDIDTKAASEFIIKQIECNPYLKNIRLIWFGGEPFCNKDGIVQITSEIMPVITQKKININASIITNGSDIDVDFLKEQKIDSVQITVDGTGDTYALYKGVKKDVFDKVLDNIRILSENKSINLGVRINCDKNNIKSVKELIEKLYREGLLNKIYVYLAPIKFCEISDLSEKEFISIQFQFYDYLCKNNLKELLKKQLPKSRLMSCGFVGSGSYVIDVDGTLKKCERDIGQGTKVVGDIKIGRFYNAFERCFQADDIMDKCFNCDIYPICRGGCKKMRMSGEFVDCNLKKKELIEKLKLLVS